MLPSHHLLLQLVASIALFGTASASIHEEAPIVTVNGTLSEHFAAHVTDLQPGACVIFEAQARAPQEKGELCIAHAGVKMSPGTDGKTGHTSDVLPDGCAARGMRIAEVVTADPKDCFLHKAQQLDQATKVFEECDPESPYSFQFIDPTRHRPTYGGKVSHPTAALCGQLLDGVPEAGTVQAGNLMALTLQRGRIQHNAFSHKCLKSATYVVINPCNASISSMLFEGTSQQCLAGGWEGDTKFPRCTAEQGGEAVPGAAKKFASELAVAGLVAATAAAAVALLHRKHRAQQQRQSLAEEAELTGGFKSSSADPDAQQPQQQPV